MTVLSLYSSSSLSQLNTDTNNKNNSTTVATTTPAAAAVDTGNVIVTTTSTSNNNNNSDIELSSLLQQQHDDDISVLTQLLSHYEQYHHHYQFHHIPPPTNNTSDTSNRSNIVKTTLRPNNVKVVVQQSQKYRTCIQQLISLYNRNYDHHHQLQQNVATTMTDTSTMDENDVVVVDEEEQQSLVLYSNILFKIMSIYHLSEIFLLPSASNTTMGNNGSGNSSTTTFYIVDGTVRHYMDCPGIVTADTINFLRQYMISVTMKNDSDLDDNDNEMALENDEDDYMDVAMRDTDTDVEYYDYGRSTSSSSPYWMKMMSLARCGYLHEAWDLLKQHYWYTTAKESYYYSLQQQQEESSHDDATNEQQQRLRKDAQGILTDFEQIGSIFLTAPIPGGRSSSTSKRSKYSKKNSVSDDASNHIDIELTYVSELDVTYTDYQLWEIQSSSLLENDYQASSPRMQTNDTNDYPIIFTPKVAIRKHCLWRDYVHHVRTNNRLCSKCVPLHTILILLGGDWVGTSCNDDNDETIIINNNGIHYNANTTILSFPTWSEQLCCELLYKTPDLRPRSIASRIRMIMKDHNIMLPSSSLSNQTTVTTTTDYSNTASNNHEYETSIANIMQGNAGRAITELYDLGGGSGAAIPITLMALMFDLFVDAGIIPSESIMKRYDFLIDTSNSIYSHLCTSNPDIGIQLAVRILAPYAMKPNKPEITASIANLFEHYIPTTTHYARTVLALCSPLLTTNASPTNKINKSLSSQRHMLLDAIISSVIMMYEEAEQQQVPHTNQMVEISLLLFEGFDLESDILSQPWLGRCYRLIESECSRIITHLLHLVVEGQHKENGSLHVDVPAIIKSDPFSTAIGRYLKNSQNTSVHRLPAISKHLVNLVQLCSLIMDGEQHHEQAKYMMEFLSDNAISSISMHWQMLNLVHSLIERRMENLFDQHHITILLQCLSNVSHYVEYVASNKNTISQKEILDMKMSFQGLLTTIICSKNLMKRKTDITLRLEDQYTGCALLDL